MGGEDDHASTIIIFIQKTIGRKLLNTSSVVFSAAVPKIPLRSTPGSFREYRLTSPPKPKPAWRTFAPLKQDAP